MQHLKTRAQFQALLATRPVAFTPHFALHWLAVPAGLPGFGSGGWIGAMAPKRWAKRAVTRNAIKRQVYAVSALSWSGDVGGLAPCGACLIRLRSLVDRSAFPGACSEPLRRAVRAELLDLWRQALRRQPGLRVPTASPAG